MGSSQSFEISSIGLNGDSVMDNVSCDIAQSLLRLWSAASANESVYSTANLMPTPNGTTLYVNRNSFI